MSANTSCLCRAIYGERERCREIGGFTVIELLVVAALIFILVALMLPPLDNRPMHARGVQCMNNLKQLALGWVMYGEDNKEQMVPNQPYVGRNPFPTNNWVGGVMDWSSSGDNTNTELLLKFGLSPYIKSPSVYHCPADDSRAVAGPRVRSYSMNGFMGNNGEGALAPGWKRFTKMTELTRPAGAFVFVDEHPNSIDDGFFLNNPANSNTWSDLPASRHNGAATFAFADGHVELHKWLEDSTKQLMVPKGPKPRVQVQPGTDSRDLIWVLEGTTERQTNIARANPSGK